MKDHDYPTAFPLKHQRKDLELALKYAGTKNQSLPVAAASTDLFKKVTIQRLSLLLASQNSRQP